nr:MAG TPA: hypothetical protein [Caudoviricetes sp.]
MPNIVIADGIEVVTTCKGKAFNTVVVNTERRYRDSFYHA